MYNDDDSSCGGGLTSNGGTWKDIVTFRMLGRVLDLSGDDLQHLTAKGNLLIVLGSVLSASLFAPK